MRLYLYGALLARRANDVPDGVRGIGGSRVRTVACGELSAIVSPVEGHPDRSSLDSVRAHDDVLRAVVAAGFTVAAVRFGQTFGTEAELCEGISDRAGTLARLLDENEGCVEMRILLRSAPEDAAGEIIRVSEPAAPGTAYLESLRASARTARRLSLRAAIGPAVRSEIVEELSSSRGVVFAHLIRRSELTEYREAVAAHPALADAQLIGPLALYSFQSSE